MSIEDIDLFVEDSTVQSIKDGDLSVENSDLSIKHSNISVSRG